MRRSNDHRCIRSRKGSSGKLDRDCGVRNLYGKRFHDIPILSRKEGGVMLIFFDIDTQHDFMDRDGALYVPDAETIKDKIKFLLELADREGITTISSRCAHEPGDPEFQIFPPHCIEGTRGAERIFPDLPRAQRYELPVDAVDDPAAEIETGAHYIVKKKVFDLFSNAWLDGLRARGTFKDKHCVVFG